MRELGDQIVDGAAGERYAGTTRQVYAVRVSYYKFKFAIKLMNYLMNHLAPLTVLMVGGYLAINDETTVGTIVAFISGSSAWRSLRANCSPTTTGPPRARRNTG